MSLHRTHTPRRISIIFLSLFSMFSCVSKPPVVEIIDDTEANLMVGTPGSVSYPEGRDRADSDGEPSEVSENLSGGCTRDSQCKGERVCIAGTCVSPQYAAEYEAKYMASAGVGPGVGGVGNEAAAGNPIIEVLLPPLENRKLQCKKADVVRCMKECDSGNLASCYAVGRIYENHPENPKAPKYGVYAYRKACDGGDAVSCIRLSRWYFMGLIVGQNLGVAFSLNVDGCVQKNMYACVNAAVFLENGVGVEKNVSMAAEYYPQACIAGHDPSCAKANPTDEPVPATP